MSRILPQVIAPHGFTLTIILATLALLASSASSQVTPPAQGHENNPLTATITWDAADPCLVDKVVPVTATCNGAPFTGICAGRSKWIEWQSVPPKKYDIYFSPFVAASLHAGGNGKAKGKIHNSAPYSIYKYSIVADGCSLINKVNDPRIRIDH